MSVVITNGFKNFHLAGAAAEAETRGQLKRFVAGLYPTSRIKRWASQAGLDQTQRYPKFLERGVPIADARVASLAAADLLSEIGSLMMRQGHAKLAEAVERQAMRLFSKGAARELRGAGRSAQIYHFRAGYGLTSIDTARALGLVTLCDHSIAHPATLDWLVANDGAMPEPHQLSRPAGFWAFVADDIARADHVVVNSEFVRQTFIAAGAPTERISVIYLGVDDAFLQMIPPRTPRQPGGPLRMMFAGGFNARKGANVLAAAAAALPPSGWTLEIAGTVDPLQDQTLATMQQNPNVRHIGSLTRSQLAAKMAQTDVFVFPTLAEGSARVIFEALAAGCYVVTTPNAGSIVEDGVHGALIRPGDADQLGRVLQALIKDPQTIAAVGARNAAQVRAQYTQRRYGEQLAELYGQLLVQA